MHILAQQQMGRHCTGWGRPAGVCNALALAAVTYPRLQDGSIHRDRAGLFDVFLASRRGLRAPAHCRGPDRPLILASGVRPISVARPLHCACRRSASGPSLLKRPIATHLGLGAVAGSRPQSLNTPDHLVHQDIDPSPVGFHQANPLNGSNRIERNRANVRNIVGKVRNE